MVVYRQLSLNRAVITRDPTARATLARAGFGVIVAGLCLGGCGVRGSLEAPPEAKASGEATRPDAAGAAGSSSDAEQRKPQRPFILDSLIR